MSRPGAGSGSTASPPLDATPTVVSTRPFFRDATDESGLSFVHFNGMTGELYFVETVGAGAALFDYDRDGDLDLYLVQGRLLGEGKSLEEALVPDGAEAPFIDRLYRNDTAPGPDGRPALSFTDVTEESGIRAGEFGIAVAVGDVNGDGNLDLYLAGYGPNQLWLNQGDGSFREATLESGTGEERWSCAAAFVDFDLDGDQDLLIGNYVDFRLETHEPCYGDTSERDYCGPLSYRPLPDRLLENLGDGTFRDVSAESRVGEEPGNTLGFAIADFDGDGHLDVYVASDGMANRLLMNQRDGSFRNTALLAGVAYNREGAPEASMGVDAGDCDGDGDEDLFMTHLVGETNTLYLNDGRAFFRDRSSRSGLAASSLDHTGFGTAFLDADNDGDLDLFVANGAVKAIRALREAGDPYPLHEPNQVFLNDGTCTFEELGAEAEPALRLSEVSRGAAFGDIDGDGDTDVVIVNSNGRARLLLNERGQDASWIGFRPLRRGGTVAVGALLTVEAGARSFMRRSRIAGSYASSNDPRVLVGLSTHEGPSDVVVSWPGGSRERFSGLRARSYHDLVEGTGETLP